jgi:hypothetical protein
MPTISGTVYDDTGTPVGGRVVRAYRRDTGGLVGAATTSTGAAPTDPDYASVSLLLHLDGENNSVAFPDDSPSPKTATRFGDVAVITAQSRFGGASAVFDGNGDYLSYDADAAFSFGSGDFTIECWVRCGNHLGTIVSGRDIASNGVTFRVHNNRLEAFYGGGTAQITASDTHPISTWFHAALCRQGTTVRLFQDGVQVGSTTWAVDIHGTTTAPIRIGSYTGESFNGHLDEVRITKGVARYTAAFTAPTEPFPNTAVVLDEGGYQINTAYTGECSVLFLDDAAGTVYNDLVVRATPV